MNNPLKQCIRNARRITLKDADRVQMRAHFSKMLGVPETSARRPWMSMLAFHRSAALGFGMALVALMVTSGVAAAAEGSIPGDILYGVKVRITEEVRSALARSPASKAAWETKRIERRLSEAEKVIQKKMNGSTLSTLQLHIAAHTDRVQKSIDALERTGQMQEAATASSNMEAPLTAHKQILREITKSRTDGDRLIKNIEREEESLQKRRRTLEERIDAREAKKNEDEKRFAAERDQPFSKKEESRRRNREDQLIKKAELELNVSVDRDSEDNEDDTRRTR